MVNYTKFLLCLYNKLKRGIIGSNPIVFIKNNINLKSKNMNDLQDDEEFGNMDLSALVQLREILSDVCSPKTDASSNLLETVDAALDKLITKEFINKK